MLSILHIQRTYLFLKYRVKKCPRKAHTVKPPKSFFRTLFRNNVFLTFTHMYIAMCLQKMYEECTLLEATCDTFIKTLEEIMNVSNSNSPNDFFPNSSSIFHSNHSGIKQQTVSVNISFFKTFSEKKKERKKKGIVSTNQSLLKYSLKQSLARTNNCAYDSFNKF